MKVFFSLLSLTLLLSCSTKKQADQPLRPDDLVPVRLLALQELSAQRTIPVTGYLSTQDQLRLSFKTGGVVERMFVKEGDIVRKGQVLASIRPTEINALAEQAQLGFQKATRDFERAKALYADSVATLEQFQNAKTALEVAQQQVNQARFNQGFVRLIAPENGVVLRKLKNDGELSGPGEPVVVIGTATNQKGWILSTSVTDKEWSALHPGDSAVVTLEAMPDKTFRGTLTKKAIAADPMNGSFAIELSVNLGGQPGAAGMFGRALIQTGQSASGFPVPYDALLEADGKSAYVFVTSDQKTVRKVKVLIDQIGDDQVRILSGLESYPFVVVSGSPYLRDGSAIKVINQ